MKVKITENTNNKEKIWGNKRNGKYKIRVRLWRSTLLRPYSAWGWVFSQIANAFPWHPDLSDMQILSWPRMIRKLPSGTTGTYTWKMSKAPVISWMDLRKERSASFAKWVSIRSPLMSVQLVNQPFNRAICSAGEDCAVLRYCGALQTACTMQILHEHVYFQFTYKRRCTFMFCILPCSEG